MATLKDKLSISLGSGALLLLLNTTMAYKLSGYTVNNCPTLMGRYIHLLLFVAISYLTMPKDKPEKVKYSWYAFLIAFYVFSPQIITIVNSIINSTTQNGCLTPMGTVVHVLLYVAFLVGVMYL